MLFLFVLALSVLAGVLTYHRSWVGALCVVLLNPFDFPIELGYITLHLNEVLISAVLGAWLLGILIQRRWRALSWYEVLWAVPFIIGLALSAYNAVYLSSVVKQILRWLELILLAWYVGNVMRPREAIKAVVNALLIVGTLTCILGIVQTLAGPEAGINAGRQWLTLYNNSTMRAYSTFGHSNQFAGYIILLIPLAFVQFMEETLLLFRILIGAATLIMITALVFTFSRGAWVATALMGGVLIYLNVPKKIILIATLVVAVGLTIYLLNQGPLQKAQRSVVERAVSFKQPAKDDSFNFRIVCAQTACKMFVRHPWIGFGAGEYLVNIRKYFDEKYYAWQAIDTHIHNLYLQILVESGIVGLAGFLLWIGYCLVVQVRGFLRLAAGYDRQLLSACIAGAMAFMIHNNFDVVTVFARGIHLAVILGLGLSLARSSLTGGMDGFKMPETPVSPVRGDSI